MSKIWGHLIWPLEAGLRDLGENYAQELLAKAREVEGMGGSPRWHFIGRLQSNKVRYLIGLSIHSVDRDTVIKEIRKRASVDNPVQVYIEANVGGEEQKGGRGPRHWGDWSSNCCPFRGWSSAG